MAKKEEDVLEVGVPIEREKARRCIRCELFAEAEGDVSRLEAYLAVIKPQDLAETPVYRERIAVCRSCELLLGATCQACGCYVEFRANLKDGKCPKRKWCA